MDDLWFDQFPWLCLRIAVLLSAPGRHQPARRAAGTHSGSSRIAGDAVPLAGAPASPTGKLSGVSARYWQRFITQRDNWTHFDQDDSLDQSTDPDARTETTELEQPDLRREIDRTGYRIMEFQTNN